MTTCGRNNFAWSSLLSAVCFFLFLIQCGVLCGVPFSGLLKINKMKHTEMEKSEIKMEKRERE
jgi:hypothetical protein